MGTARIGSYSGPARLLASDGQEFAVHISLTVWQQVLDADVRGLIDWGASLQSSQSGVPPEVGSTLELKLPDGTSGSVLIDRLSPGGASWTGRAVGNGSPPDGAVGTEQ